jgi:hypothetical protein
MAVIDRSCKEMITPKSVGRRVSISIVLEVRYLVDLPNVKDSHTTNTPKIESRLLKRNSGFIYEEHRDENQPSRWTAWPGQNFPFDDPSCFGYLLC